MTSTMSRRPKTVSTTAGGGRSLSGRVRRVGPIRTATAMVAIVVVLILPTMLSGANVSLAASIAINVVAAYSLLITLGFGGYFSLAQGALFGIGCYVVAIGATRTHWDLLILLLGCVVVGAVAGALIAVSCFRTTDLYLAMITLAYGFVLFDVATNWVPVTGGTQGLLVSPELAGSAITPHAVYITTVIFGLVVAVLVGLTRRNKWGRALALIRQNHTAAESVGINTRASMLMVFAFGGVVAAVAGGLYIGFLGLADPTVFGFNQTTTALTFVVLAGSRSVWGVGIVSSALLYLQAKGANQSWGSWLPFCYACLVIIVLMVAPGGLASLSHNATRYYQLFNERLRGRRTEASDHV